MAGSISIDSSPKSIFYGYWWCCAQSKNESAKRQKIPFSQRSWGQRKRSAKKSVFLFLCRSICNWPAILSLWKQGEVLPEEKRFDSNCITPGTVFMVKLQEQLDYFVNMKISTDPLWQKTQVILSGHQVTNPNMSCLSKHSYTVITLYYRFQERVNTKLWSLFAIRKVSLTIM